MDSADQVVRADSQQVDLPVVDAEAEASVDPAVEAAPAGAAADPAVEDAEVEAAAAAEFRATGTAIRPSSAIAIRTTIALPDRCFTLSEIRF